MQENLQNTTRMETNVWELYIKRSIYKNQVFWYTSLKSVKSEIKIPFIKSWREMAQYFRALAEDLDPIPSTHIMADNHP